MGKIFTRAAALVAGLAVAASSIVSTELPAAASVTDCQASFSKYSTIRTGSTGRKAKAMECLLADAGFRTKVDGAFSAGDAAALAKFRSAIGLSPLRAGGRRAWSALLSRGDRPELKRGAKGADVVRLQLSLRAAGFSKVPIHGTFGRSTVVVVKAAQARRDLKRTGVATAALWKALQHGRVTAPSVVKKKASSKGRRALAYARRQLGEGYRYGGTGPDKWDCSGLTMRAWKSVGVRLPRTSQAQYRVGKKVKKSHLRKGDLVFFYSGRSHVALYAGKGKVIHASRPGRPVAYIKMKYMPYAGARRPH